MTEMLFDNSPRSKYIWCDIISASIVLQSGSEVKQCHGTVRVCVSRFHSLLVNYDIRTSITGHIQFPIKWGSVRGCVGVCGPCHSAGTCVLYCLSLLCHDRLFDSDREEQQEAARCRHPRFMTPCLSLKKRSCLYTLTALSQVSLGHTGDINVTQIWVSTDTATRHSLYAIFYKNGYLRFGRSIILESCMSILLRNVIIGEDM